jgi:RND family efflux transporter MFP subunit
VIVVRSADADPPARDWRAPWVDTAAKLAIPAALLAAVLYRRTVAPIDAEAHRVRRGDVVGEVYGRGAVESRREAQLGFDVVGRISDVLVDEGDRVRIGQVLAHLAPEQLRADLQTASSGAAAARASLARLDSDAERAAATLAFAEGEAHRMQQLAAGGAAPARDLDLAVQQVTLARTEVARARAARAEALRGIQTAAGGVAQRRVAVERLTLVAPFDGLVVRRYRDTGDTATVGATVLRLVATDRLWVRAAVDESALADLREGQAARIQFPGAAGGAREGAVDRIGRESDRQTQEILVDLSLPTPPDWVAIGQRADAWIETGRRRGVVAVPPALIRGVGTGTWCYVDRDGRVARAPVRLGLVGRDAVEVTAGLAEGATVLTGTSADGALAEGRRWRAAVAR